MIRDAISRAISSDWFLAALVVTLVVVTVWSCSANGPGWPFE